MPPYEHVTKEFLKQVLNEEKDLFRKEDVKFINMPHFDELSVKRIMPEVRNFPEAMLYFPSKERKGLVMNREYFFNILNTVVPKYVQKIVQNANNLRNEASN